MQQFDETEYPGRELLMTVVLGPASRQLVKWIGASDNSVKDS